MRFYCTNFLESRECSHHIQEKLTKRSENFFLEIYACYDLTPVVVREFYERAAEQTIELKATITKK